MDILDEIVANKREEVAIQQRALSCDYLRELTQEKIERDGAKKLRSMKAALAASPSGIIAEFKRKSPSKGWIHADARPEEVVPAYSAAGAAALSVLTDEKYFGGQLEYVRQVRPLVGETPVLRKEFIIDEYQLWEARLYGADAVLLIAADLPPALYADLTARAHDLGLEVLLEVHDPSELAYLQWAVPDMLGVNNRSLGTFHTDVQHSFDIARLMQESVSSLPEAERPLLVSESGISDPAVVRRLREVGFRGFLIGECFMRDADPGQALRAFIQELLS